MPAGAPAPNLSLPGGEPAMNLVYKIAPGALWREAEKAGLFTGAPVDVADGFIHFSTAGQAQETAAKHFRNQAGLLLIALETGRLGPALRFEPSRGGALFPHLHASLSLDAVRWVAPLSLDGDGVPDVGARLGEFA
jgi:uncharacterized protein (DUF952 family)